MYSIQVIVFLAVYGNVETINGWSLYQCIFFLGVFFVIDSSAMITYFVGLIQIPEDIRSGKLDLYITKPMNSLFIVATRHFEFGFIFNVLYGFGLIAFSTIKLGIHLTLFKVFGFIVLLIMMYFLYFTLMTIAYSSAFWFIRVTGLTNLHHEMINCSFRVPGIAYTGIWRTLIVGVIPYGMIATLPTQFFTGMLEAKYIVYAIGVCIFYWIACVFLWKRGLKIYNSASS